MSARLARIRAVWAEQAPFAFRDGMPRWTVYDETEAERFGVHPFELAVTTSVTSRPTIVFERVSIRVDGEVRDRVMAEGYIVSDYPRLK
jgi:hypothetical protein